MKPVFVIDVDGPLLLGRSAIQALNLEKIYAVGDGPSIDREYILQCSEYTGVFKEQLGVFISFEYDIKVNKEAPTKVQRQRRVPGPLEKKIKEEIERMILEM